MKKLSLILGSLTLVTNIYGAIYIIGDSTASNYENDRYPRMGWGQTLGNHLKDIEVQNAAKSGRSTKSFKDEGHWGEVEKNLKDGDYVFIQFGHNDQKKDDPKRFTTPDKDYSDNLKEYVKISREKGATPVLLTSIHRRRFKDGKIVDSHKDYLTATRKVAGELNVPLIDLASKSEVLFNQYGEDGSKKLFMILEKGENPNYPEGSNDNTHLSELGANEISKLVVQGIKENNLPLQKNIK